MSVALRQLALRTTAVLAVSASVAFAAGCGSSSSNDGSSSGGSSSGGTTQTETKPQIDATTGKDIFNKAGCISCHTLADAGSTGQIGPNLDQAKPGKDVVVAKVTNGDGRMPSFGDKLTPEQIDTVATYVSTVAGK